MSEELLLAAPDLMIAAPIVTGIAISIPEKMDRTAAMYLALLSSLSGIFGLYLRDKGDITGANNAQKITSLLQILSIIKSFQMI